MSITSQIKYLHASLPSEVRLVAVSKFHPIEALREAYDAGQRVFGESRPQEMTTKQAALPADIEWHMIGHLQTNKVKMIAPYVSLIHSVDSERLVAEIDRCAARVGRVIDILFEVHLAAEESKSGWNFDELVTFLQSGGLEPLKNVRIRGVMGMATNTDNEAVIRADFERLAQHKESLKNLFGEEFDTLSMGMSDDYKLAIECGSTMVRIGSSIFGSRY